MSRAELAKAVFCVTMIMVSSLFVTQFEISTPRARGCFGAEEMAYFLLPCVFAVVMRR